MGAPLRERDRTTVRIRTKNSQYVYNEGSLTNQLNPKANSNLSNNMFDNKQVSPREREHNQALIANYREEKI
jgi:hypothetical protein